MGWRVLRSIFLKSKTSLPSRGRRRHPLVLVRRVSLTGGGHFYGCYGNMVVGEAHIWRDKAEGLADADMAGSVAELIARQTC
jgi:hypothetical protein